MVDSPAYRLNHEEVIKALEEGIAFAENLNPIEAVPDEHGAREGDDVQARRAKDGRLDRRRRRRRRCRRGRVLVAAGTTPNMTYEKEAPGHVPARREEEVLPAARRAPRTATAVPRSTPDAERLLHVVRRRRHGSSRYYGDNHPRYAGNVVKAMASAKDGFPHVVELFARELAALDPAAQAERDAAWTRARSRGSTTSSLARVEDVVRLTPTIVEVIVKAPAAARHFQPGPVLPAAELRVDRAGASTARRC